MLKQSLIPTPLLKPNEIEPVRISVRPLVLRFRGLFLLTRLSTLAIRLVGLKIAGRLDMQAVGQLAREFCQQMGVLWIKVGQLVSTRRDLFAQEICDELVKLQDRADGFASEVAQQIVTDELGRPISQLFSEFEEVPFAAASISQIHRARLRQNGVWVAVKIQRPHIETTFRQDMRVVKRLVRWLIRWSIKPHARWSDLAWEIEQVMQEELDYRFEASNMRRMRKTLRKHNVYVPKVYAAYSTQRVLVMEFVDGVTMTDYLKMSREDPQRLNRWLDENGIDPNRVGRRIIVSHLRQAYEDNLFHGDLHPGNILLLANSRIAFIDFGSVGFLERDFSEKYDLYSHAMFTRDYAKLVDLYLLFAVDLPPADLSELKSELIRCLQAFETRRRVNDLPYGERSLGALNREMIQLLGKYGIALDWTFLRIMRTWFTMDTSLSVLMPRASLRRIQGRYYRQRDRRLRKKLVKFPPLDPALLQAAIELPKTTYEQTVYRGTIIRRMGMVFEGTTTRFSQFLANMFGWMAISTLVAVLFLLAVFLHQQYGLFTSPTLAGVLGAVPTLDFAVWIVVFVVLVHSYRSLVNVKNRFQQHDAQLPTA